MDLEKYRKAVAESYDSMAEYIDRIRIKDFRRETTFECIVTASVTKCYDFTRHVATLKKGTATFYYLGTLRGLCEELIAITYLQSLPKAELNEILEFRIPFEMQETIIKQAEFFDVYNPHQLIIHPDWMMADDRIEFIRNRPIKKGRAKRKGYKELPSIWKMAQQVGFSDLYNYLYFATSSLVHFRIETLLKMGWNSGAIEGETMKNGIFSPYNYENYYWYFNVFYGNWIFSEMIRNYNKTLGFSNKIKQKISQLEKLKKKITWPELTTFEHMNIRVEPMHYIMHAMRMIKKEES